MCHVIPAFENAKYITPFYYSNAADIFSGQIAEIPMYGIGFGATLTALTAAFIIYKKRDLAA